MSGLERLSLYQLRFGTELRVHIFHHRGRNTEVIVA